MKPRYLRDLVVTYQPNVARLTYSPDPITHPSHAAAILVPLLSTQPQEVFGCLYLDTRSRVIAYREIHRGTLTHVEVRARDVIIPGLLINAHSVILAHTHPSGDSSPSPDDCALTKHLIDACALVDLAVVDHVIVGDGNYCSFKETGRL